MRGRSGYPLLAAAIAAIAAAGCGGGNSAPIVSVQGASGASGANGAVALSKPEFIKQGDAICGEANAALAGVSGGTAGGDQQAQVSQELQITRSELSSLQSLTPPDQDRSTLDKFLSGLQDEVGALNHMKSAVDTSSADTELTTAKSNAESAAASYGFKDCANGASSQTQPSTSGTAPSTTTPIAPATTTPAAPAPTTPVAPAAPPAPAPPSGGTGGATGGSTGGSTGGGTGGGTGGTGGGSGGVSP